MTLAALLCDFDTDETIADLSYEGATVKLSPRLNRPLAASVTLPGDMASIRGLAGDGLPAVQVGKRTLKIIRNGVLRANTLLWNVAPSGDPNSTSVVLTGYDPLILFGKRTVRDSTGNLVDPDFTLIGATGGADILVEAINATNTYVGTLPIDLGGTFSTTIDLAAFLTDWPMNMADLLTLLTNTGVCDVTMDPIDHAHYGYAAGLIGRINIVDHYGNDLSGSVHFDYATGDYSLASLRRTFDMDELCNRLVYYFGPKLNKTTYKGDISATDPSPPGPDLSAYLALETASRDEFGVYEEIRIFDDSEGPTSGRPMFHELWKTEVALRVQPRQMLYMQAAAGDGCPFQPFDDYNIGDVVSTNAADIVGPAISGGQQRIYGFDIDQDASGPERVSEFIVSSAGL